MIDFNMSGPQVQAKPAFGLLVLALQYSFYVHQGLQNGLQLH